MAIDNIDIVTGFLILLIIWIIVPD